jgi:hypothetical protein
LIEAIEPGHICLMQTQTLATPCCGYLRAHSDGNGLKWRVLFQQTGQAVHHHIRHLDNCARHSALDRFGSERTRVGQYQPDMAGLPDWDSAEEWLSLPLIARRSRISAGQSQYVIVVGSAL